MQDEHYLKEELYALVRKDPAIFEFLQSGSLDGIWYWDLEQPANEWMSPRFWTTMGFDPAERRHLASEWQDLINKEDLETALENFHKHCEDPLHPYDQIVRYRHRDGSTVWVRCRGIVIRDDAGKPVRMLGAHTDLTELKKAEADLVRSGRLESLGLLAGGIAHDFNNLLTGILGNIQLARLELSSPEKAEGFLESAEAALDRAKALAAKLLTFSRGGDPVVEDLELKDFLHSTLLYCMGVRGDELEERYGDDLSPVRADRGQLTQVVNALVQNALDAMPGGGRLRVEAENILFTAPDGETGLQGNYVRLCFQDRGCGIPGENLPRIFDPYFTTKSMGSGLGLATVFSIVKKHGGRISAASTPGEGTTLTLYLPASAGYGGSAASEESEESPDACRRLLLMDDDPMIREIMTRLLERFGMELDCVDEGSAAVERYRSAMEEGRPYGAVIMDLTVPSGMGGEEAVRELLKVDPGVKAVVSSGYSSDPVMVRPRDYGFTGALGKPFDLSELRRVLRDICDLRIEEHR